MSIPAHLPVVLSEGFEQLSQRVLAHAEPPPDVGAPPGRFLMPAGLAVGRVRENPAVVQPLRARAIEARVSAVEGDQPGRLQRRRRHRAPRHRRLHRRLRRPPPCGQHQGPCFHRPKGLPLIADGGSIIVTSADDGVKGGPGRSIYAATEAAGRILVRSWIQELKDRNIRVNAVSPASVETPGLAGLAGIQNPGDFFAAMAAHMPGGHNIRPEEVAAAVTFLASDDASGINGFDLQVDAGLAQICTIAPLAVRTRAGRARPKQVKASPGWHQSADRCQAGESDGRRLWLSFIRSW
jgi:hypothetical protein